MDELHEKYKAVLKKKWGYDDFYPVQKKIISSLSQGKDTLGLMPTGGGKSITFQVPALVMEGVCIVVTPLIALMNDQVDRLLSLDIKAVALHSGIAKHEMKIKLDNALYGAYKLLYISPERLGNPDFKARIKHMNVSFFAIDEAHCISQWGYDFRPSYLNIASVREIKPEAPILALTATATPEVAKDIQLKLRFKEENLIKTDFTRPNLVYFVRQSESKLFDLIKIVKSIRGCGIVYVRSRKKTKEISDYLRKEQISSDYFHAGLDYNVRKQKQDNWTDGSSRIIVATNAFGMGIDKSNVRFVVHIDFPDSLEEYFQEAGRAGRDGDKSFAVLLAGSRDKGVLKKRLANSYPEISKIKTVYNAICNYLRIPIGSGKGIAYDFNLIEFTKAYKFEQLKTYNALKLLEQQGYLELSDELQNPSRVYFSINRDDLYKFQVKNKNFDAFIKLVLRSYTGLFSDYVPVNESEMAKRAGLTRDQVYQYFVRLNKMNIIKYIPGKKTALIIMLEERLKENSIYISPENYFHRKERAEKRIEAIKKYAFDMDKCRSILLLEYFGQERNDECGQCDYCRNKGKVFSDEDRSVISGYILDALKHGAISPEKIVAGTKHNTELLSFVLRTMLDEELIRYDDSGKLELAG